MEPSREGSAHPKQEYHTFRYRSGDRCQGPGIERQDLRKNVVVLTRRSTNVGDRHRGQLPCL